MTVALSGQQIIITMLSQNEQNSSPEQNADCWNISYSAFLLGVAYSVWPTRRVALSVSDEALRQQSSRNTVYIYRTYVLTSIYIQFHEFYSTAQRHFQQTLSKTSS